MIMYLMMFITAIVLRLRSPDKPAAFKIPGGLWGLITVCSVGIIGTLITIIISFFPPEDVGVQSLWKYIGALLLGIIALCLPPLISKDRHPVINNSSHAVGD